MEVIEFKAGPQVAGTEVIDLNGVHWTVLKNIGNALAQPREGQYYTKVVKPPMPPEEILIEKDQKKLVIELVITETEGNTSIQLKR